MTAKEVREYRVLSRRLVEVEERSRLLEKLISRKLGLAEEEGFVMKEAAKHKNVGEGSKTKVSQRRDLLALTHKYKLKDNNLFGNKLRRKKNWLRGTLERSMGSRSSEFRKLQDDIKTKNGELRKKLKTKYKKKIDHLEKKFGSRYKEDDRLDDNMRRMVGVVTILTEDSEKMEPQEMREPTLVQGEGEGLSLSTNEKKVLALGPKYCVYSNLDEEMFSAEVEECIMKLRWDLMNDDDEDKEGRLEDIAYRILVGDEECDRVEDDMRQEDEMVEACRRQPYNRQDGTFNFARRKTTDLKGNSRVYFPKKAISFEMEAILETIRVELLGTFRNYVSQNCGKGGRQKEKLSKLQSEGLKSLKMRVKNGEIVIVPTDKSGSLSVMSRDCYIEAGMSHTLRDKLVGMEEVKMAQRELNGHISMLIKIFKIGAYWKHGYRIRETMMGENQAVCPLSLLYKDHKGWVPGGGSKPPTRPVAGGHLGINLHISEVVSDILDPVVERVVGGREVISTEDMVARVEILNDDMVDWSSGRYWAGMVEEDLVACGVCLGVDRGVYSREYPELCSCEEGREADGIDDKGRILTTMGYMRWLRRKNWERLVGWSDEDLERVYDSSEVLHEDLQDQTIPMVVVGSDVVQLYPSLDIEKVVEVVGRAVMETGVVWEEIDYLEASRYVALNWTAEQCVKSELRRVLPIRRYNTGSRPGLRGSGPQGGERGDTEQWVFPNVRLTKHEKKLLVGTVVRLATEAMFGNHYYGFGNKIFQQLEGGPIGLRGTCSIARLVMQIFDVKWETLIQGVGLRLWLYVRYMDDGRSFCQPVKRGWRWVGDRLQYCKKWEIEDKDMTPEKMTSSILLRTMNDIETYLTFTVETGEDFDGWLPTLDTSLRVRGDNQIDYKFFEKPTTTSTVIRKESALAENQKIQILAQELVRRLFNTREDLPSSFRSRVINDYAQKVLNSGYGRDQTKRIILAGVRGYFGKVKRRRGERGFKRIHYTAMETGGSRWKKKLVGKTSWYKQRKRNSDEETQRQVGGKDRKRGKMDHHEKLKTRAVLFVPQTPLGELARRIREDLQRMENLTKFRLKVVERAGTSLQNLLSQTSIWRGIPCGREVCVPCCQGGEEIPPCTRTSVVYENICVTCNPEATRRGDMETPATDQPSLYVGESSRSLQRG